MRGHEQGDALDLLEAEDRGILATLEAVDQNRGQGVEQRSRYGDHVKRLIRQVAAREAALVDVENAIAEEPALREIAARLGASTEARRSHIDRVERLSRGVKGVSLNVGQDFDAELQGLIDVLKPEVTWELAEALPTIRTALPEGVRDRSLHSARHVRRHAPTNLHPEGPRWWERAPVVSRLLTIFDHLRDFPSAARRPGSS